MHFLNENLWFEAHVVYVAHVQDTVRQVRKGIACSVHISFTQ